jgi:hypothetical protein
MCPISVEWARKPTLGSLQDVVCDGHGRGLRARLRPGALVLGDERKEGAPPAVDAAHCPRAGEDDPAAEEEEDDDVDVRRPVDQAREHVRLVRAVDVVVRVEGIEVELLVGAQPQVRVADDVLDGHVAKLELDAGDERTQGVEAVHRREQHLHEGLAAREHHLPRREQQRGALRRPEADGDGRKLLLLVERVGQEPANCLEIQAADAPQLTRPDEVVHLRKRRRVCGSDGILEIVELYEHVLVDLSPGELALAPVCTSEVLPAHTTSGPRRASATLFFRPR